MANKIKRVTVPASFYKLVPEKQNRTKYVQTSTGLLAGRAIVPKTQSDKTNVLRITRDYDVNKDNKITSQDFRKGQIIGRISSTTKPKKVVVMRHFRSGIRVRRHTRKVR